MRECVLVRAGEAYVGKQGMPYLAGLTRETAGTHGLCVAVLELAPGARSRAHLHEGIESAGYVIEGVVETRFGEGLERSLVARTGDLVFIPEGLPHVVLNPSGEPARALVVHNAGDDQDGIVLRPDLDALV